MKLNQFSQEITEARRKIKDYGKTHFTVAPSYKAQAIHFYAIALNQADEIADLNTKLGAYLDLLDGVSDSDLSAVTGFTKEQVAGFLRKANG